MSWIRTQTKDVQDFVVELPDGPGHGLQHSPAQERAGLHHLH